jgi:hypothetical protein
MSHLLLDEIYAVEWKSGRWRFKKSFGTALKFWGDDAWSNFSTYAKVAIVAMVILGEPTVMERLESRHPRFAQQYQEFQDRVRAIDPLPAAQGVFDAAQTAIAQPGNWPPAVGNSLPATLPQSAAPSPHEQYDTARWPLSSGAQ